MPALACDVAIESRVRGQMSGTAISGGGPGYALVTAAYNEREHIEKTLKSVTAQTILPRKWVVVSDGSNDGTDDVVREYAASRPFIELVRRERSHGHNFASKVYAFHLGVKRVLDMPVDFVGNLDADVSFAPSYFAELFKKFECDPGLGIAGGAICERDGEEYRPRRNNRIDSVAGAVQMFRRQCYEAMGAFLPLRNGGEDWCAQIMARMNGWRVETFTDLEVRHHRPSGATAGAVGHWFRQGLMDYSLGSALVFELCRVCWRAQEYPVVIGAAARFGGYVWACCRREGRIVPDDVVGYLRQEESTRLRLLVKSVFACDLYRSWGLRFLRRR
jgi:biofilm PGA synthesis N-glycosyltransferase PgaC